MAGFNDFLLSITNTDDLMRQAQLGNPKAYMELAKRGEMIPQAAREQGVHGRPGGRPMPGLERPAYLDRGISRNMARPAAPGAEDTANSERNALRGRGDGMESPQGLPFMSALGEQEAPSYLGANPVPQNPMWSAPQQTPGQSQITALANGNDAAASIQRGAAAADQTAGVADPTTTLPEPVKALTAAFMSEDEQDPYEGAAADLMREITSGINPERNKNMALAQAGFAMAASGSPYFLQGVGVGGQAGLKSYQESQDRDTLARIRAAQIGTDLSQTRERKRSNRASEGLTAAQQAETARSNAVQEGLEGERNRESQRSNLANERLSQQQLGISAQNAATAAGNLKIAQDNFAFTQRQYEEGKATKEALDKAEIEYRNAQVEGQKALNLDRSTDIQVGEDNTLYNIDKSTNKATPIIGPDNKPIKAMPKSTSAAAFKTQFLKSAGWSDAAIADVLAGKRQLTQAQIMDTATKYANAQAATEIDVTKQSAIFNQAYQEAVTTLSQGAPSATTETPAAAQEPAAGTSQIPVGATATNPTTKEKVRWDGKQWVPVK